MTNSALNIKRDGQFPQTAALIEDCDTLPVGMEFAIFNSFESVRCSNASAGEHYMSNG